MAGAAAGVLGEEATSIITIILILITILILALDAAGIVGKHRLATTSSVRDQRPTSAP